MKNPIVSVILCNYNHAQFLSESIISVLNQSYENIEFIVVDDGSTDNSLEVIKKFENLIDDIVLKTNAGQRSAYNAGFFKSKGEYLLFLDADDVLDIRAVELAINKFKINISKVHFKMKIIDENGNFQNNIFPRYISDGNVGDRLLKNGWLYNSPPASANIYKRTAIEKLFPIPITTNDKHGADFFLIYGSCLFGDVATVESPMASYRIINIAAASDNFIFGNAAKMENEPLRQIRREEDFCNLIRNRINKNFLHKNLSSLPTLKVQIGIQAAVSKCFKERISKNKEPIIKLIRLIGIDKQRKSWEIVVLLLWSFFVTFFPVWITRSSIKYFCNRIAR